MKIGAQALIPVILITVLSACGPAPVPTPNATDVQNTAVSLAQTAISLTKTAFPTATALPPTVTPSLTFTPAPTPAAPGGTPLGLGSPTPDLCSGPAPSAPLGPVVQVKFVNKSGGTVNLAFGMMQPNALGECGVYSFSFGTFDSPVVKILMGCYWGYAWVTGKKPSTAQSIQPLCFTDITQTRAVVVGTEVIDFNP
jgi:hypothetical protein